MKKLLSIAFLGLIIAGLISALCVILLPNKVTLQKRPYVYRTSKNGTILWYDQETGVEKLQITSNLLSLAEGTFNSIAETKCGSSVVEINLLEHFEEYSFQVNCWSIQSEFKSNFLCGDEANPQVRDCIYMKTSDGDSISWFGGAEMISQTWPINNLKLQKATSFLSSDLPKRFGNVLDRYFLSSRGAAIHVDLNTPLYVSILPNEAICLEASYSESQLVGPTYLKLESDKNFLELNYTVCIGESPKDVHQIITNPGNGYIQRPKELPDLLMMKDPIWSTWARYKSLINQTTVEDFAKEILFYNFTNSQIEIDDGYESNYGDFTFDQIKFPNAKRMINQLHDQGFRVTTWVTPFINLNSKNYAYARQKKFFISNENQSPAVIRWWNGRGSLIDFTNPEAANWYTKVLTDVKAAYGLDSFKFDAGETSYLPKSGLNYTARKSKNPGDYTTEYARAAFEIGGKMAEMRSAWKTQDKSFYMRLMDKGSSWGTLRGFQTVIPTALTFSILGYPFILPDMIGGNAYVFGRNDSKPDRELYIRWIELGAFLPCMQFSVSPWQYDATVISIAHRYVKLHRTVVYNELVLAANRYISGEMSLLVAPLWFQAKHNDEVAFTIDDQFMVGDKYLVAPVIEKGATQRDIYLPGDKTVKWKDKMRLDCTDNSELEGCIEPGGNWIMSYEVHLEEISWWEKLD